MLNFFAKGDRGSGFWGGVLGSKLALCSASARICERFRAPGSS